MEDECSEWIDECLKVFPKLGKYVITARYYRMSKKMLSRIKMYTLSSKDIDVEALLLRGESKSETKVELRGFCQIQINSRLREIENAEVRKQIVQHAMIHDLLHAERKDFKTSGKNKKAKQKKAYEKEFDEEVFQRFNKLRELNGLPAIKKREDLDLAISKVLTELDEKTSQNAKKPAKKRIKS
nr:hypothetical protein [Candidatus Freyarchaeota archaeon]